MGFPRELAIIVISIVECIMCCFFHYWATQAHGHKDMGTENPYLLGREGEVGVLREESERDQQQQQQTMLSGNSKGPTTTYVYPHLLGLYTFFPPIINYSFHLCSTQQLLHFLSYFLYYSSSASYSDLALHNPH